MRKMIVIGMLLLATLTGCIMGTVKTTFQITDNCTLDVLYDNDTASPDRRLPGVANPSLTHKLYVRCVNE
jgi:hypothetical protein